ISASRPAKRALPSADHWIAVSVVFQPGIRLGSPPAVGQSTTPLSASSPTTREPSGETEFPKGLIDTPSALIGRGLPPPTSWIQIRGLRPGSLPQITRRLPSGIQLTATKSSSVSLASGRDSPAPAGRSTSWGFRDDWAELVSTTAHAPSRESA